MTKLNKEGWEYKKLGEVTDFSRGLTYSGKDEVPISSNVVLRSNNITLESQSLNFDELKYINDSIVIPAEKKLAKDTIFMCMSNGSMKHIGKVAYIDKDYDYAFGGFMGLMRPKAEVVCPKYLYFYFCSPLFKHVLAKIANGANINNIKFFDINQEKIPLPPLPIQHHIVEELDEINAIISAKKQQLSKLDELAQSIFYNMFGDPVTNEKGWEVKKLGEVAEVQNGFAFKSELFTRKGLPILRISNIQNNGITEDGCVFFEESSYNTDLSRYIVEPNRILIAMSGATTGKCGINKTTTCFYLNQRVGMFIENKELIETMYLFHFLLMKSEESLKIAIGVAQPNLSTSQIKDFNIPLPPLPLQETFAARVSAIEEEKAAIAASIEEMETLLASRMDYWFNW